MRKKRFMALVLVLALSLTLIPTMAFATASGAGTGDVPLELVFLGRTDTSGAPSDTEQAVPDDLKANDILWFALQVTDFTEANCSALETYGVIGMQLAFNYDSTYIVPYRGDTSSSDTKWRNNYLSPYTLSENAWSEDMGYAFTNSGTSSGLNAKDTVSTTWAEDSTLTNKGTDSIKQMKILIALGESMEAENMRFYKSTSSGVQNLAVFPMQIVTVPENGANVIETALGGATFVVNIGNIDGQHPASSGSWDAQGGNLASGTNMKTVFSYKGDPEVFPVPKEKEAITSVAVTEVATPVTGNAATKTAKAAGTPAGSVNANATVAWNGNPANFAANTEYTATVTLNVSGDYKFTVGTKVTINGEDATVASYTDGTLTATYKFPATGKAHLGTLNVSGINRPVTGAKPASSATVTNGTVENITWKPDHTSFAPATEYTVEFDVKAGANYEFTDGKNITITGIQGAKPGTDNVVVTRTDASKAHVKVVFQATAAGKINAAAVTAPAPVKGGTAVPPTVDGAAGYTVESSTWDNGLSEGDTFAGLTAYKQTITLAPKSGYEFDVNTKATVNDTSATASVKDGKLVIVVTWPATADKTITAITLSGPDKTNYKFAEAINLEGLKATVTYDNINTDTEEVAYADFESKGLTCDVKNGTVLDAVGTKTITVSAGDVKGTVNLTVEKADVEFAWSGLTQTEGSVKAPTVTTTPADDTAGDAVIKMYTEETVTSYSGCDCALNDNTVTEGHEETCNGTVTTSTVSDWVAFDATKVVDGTKVRAEYPGGDNTNAATSDEQTIKLNKKSSGGGSGSGMLTVRFDAGVNGKITKGSSTVKVARNEKLKSSDIPTVTANEGYRFLGWTLDGSKTVDPTNDTVTRSITYKALYNTGATHGAYMHGDNTGMFNPDANITRAEAAALIARLNANYNEGTKYSSSLTDIPANEWYAGVVNFCASSGLITGYDDGTFLPNNQITRQEFCAIVARYLNLSNAGEANFNDIDETIWGAGYISQLAGKGIINGYEDGSFAPNAPIKRCEVVKILNAVFDRTPDRSTVNDNIDNYSVRIPDVSTDHWAYYEILEAAIEHDHADFHKN